MKVLRLAIVGFLLTLALPAQNAEPKFEVASMRLIANPVSGLPPGFTIGPRRFGGSVTWTTTLPSLASYAYRLPGWRIEGIKADGTFYTIAATMNSDASENDVRQMFQKLIIERLKMVTHRESRELNGYALVVGKNGSKLKTAGTEPPPLPDYLTGKDLMAFEGKLINSMEGFGTTALTGRGVPVSQLVDAISDSIGAFVLDQTGMTEKYYFGFKFSPGIPNEKDPSPIVFEAVQSALGLRLEKQRGLVEVLVVDSLEKNPTEN